MIFFKLKERIHLIYYHEVALDCYNDHFFHHYDYSHITPFVRSLVNNSNEVFKLKLVNGPRYDSREKLALFRGMYNLAKSCELGILQ